MSLILASNSQIRRSMLDAAGIEFEVRSPKVDEAPLKTLLAANEPYEVAQALATAKAVDVSRSAGSDWVIGADSIVSVDSRLFDKPRDREEATEHLKQFSGREMQLTSAVALARGGNPRWGFADTAKLQVRELSESFIQSYLDQEWPDVGYCVGVFRMEGRGVTLFDRIDGSHFTILGMPLLPLLGALRERGLIP